MKIRFILLMLILMCLAGSLLAEGTCPPGYYPVNSPGVNGCAPIPGYGNTNTSMQGVVPEPGWSSRWGAIAFDESNGGVGTATGMRSKKKAEKAALSNCRGKGGEGCRIDLAYKNECGVIAWGDSFATSASAATEEEAAEFALKTCGQRSTSCKIYYSECSYPVRIQ